MCEGKIHKLRKVRTKQFMTELRRTQLIFGSLFSQQLTQEQEGSVEQNEDWTEHIFLVVTAALMALLTEAILYMCLVDFNNQSQ